MILYTSLFNSLLCPCLLKNSIIIQILNIFSNMHKNENSIIKLLMVFANFVSFSLTDLKNVFVGVLKHLSDIKSL